ncbi:MAG: 8-amino-7-oxononanoate synthase [Candidatus Omnitrophica bacterium]|nr:8-amino-7-oxononanoate synthase [Candidatus Omnitrophota bacterium]
MNRFAEILSGEISALEQQHLRRKFRSQSSPQGRTAVIEGREVLNFCSNDYLGLAADSRLAATAAQALSEYGVGAGASRLICGNMTPHLELEARIAAWKGCESALLFNSGYAANLGVISALCGREDAVYSDRLNHASIVDGIILSRAKLCRYPHNDLSGLEKLLAAGQEFRRRLIVTDSVFSMDGDLADLPRLVQLAEAYDCILMIDEAHATGVLGNTGQGAAEHFGLEGRIDIQMGTLSKAAGCFGAYVCGDRLLTDFLINFSRPFIYTTALPPAVAAAARAAVDIMSTDQARRKKLLSNAGLARSLLKNAGFDIGNSQTPIIPIFIGDDFKATALSRQLLEQGFFISAIRPPTVPRGTARLRMTVTVSHMAEDIDSLVRCLKKIFF